MNEWIYFEHFDHDETSHRTGQSKILQYWRWAGGGCGHIESGTTIVFSPPLVTSCMHWTWIAHKKNHQTFEDIIIVHARLKCFFSQYLHHVHVYRFRMISNKVNNRNNSIEVDMVDHCMYEFVLLVLFLANIRMVKQLFQYLLVHNLLLILRRHPNKTHYNLYIPVLSKYTSFPALKRQLLSNLCKLYSFMKTKLFQFACCQVT